MRRAIVLCLALLVAASLAGPAGAGAAPQGKKADRSKNAVRGKKAEKRTKARPKITRVTPMRVRVGRRIVIRGRDFKTTRKRNTVVFRRSGGGVAFAKPMRAARRKLVVLVPPATIRLLKDRESGVNVPTRFRLQVLAGKFSKRTVRRLSPVVVPPKERAVPLPGCDSDSDHDNDLLQNELELRLKTDPCKADTDGDTLTDGWEYYSAKDLNIKAVPYPGKRPFPNALDSSDSNYDFDGDGLKTDEEHRAWVASGSSFDPARVGGLDRESPLGYSDGTQTSRPFEVPAVPKWRGPAFGVPAPSLPYPALYDRDGSGTYSDDERDADADGLDNFVESRRGPGQESWWPAYWAAVEPVAVEPWPKTYYGAFTERPFQSLDLGDPDVDGDTLLDGEDDQDNDDWANAIELHNAGDQVDTAAGPRYVNAFNPCAPVRSRTCSRYVPIGG